MNQVDLIKYMKNHNLVALIGNPETLESAKSLESRGMIEKVGEFEGKPYYRISRKGELTYGLSAESSLESRKDDARERAMDTVDKLLGVKTTEEEP